MSYTLTDLFCGAGGSALGAHAVDAIELTLAANHWQLAIETHAANFPSADHLCADISQVDPRYVPRTDLLWASPECTNHSQAKGVARLKQPDLFGDTLPDAAATRSRATMWDVPRFAERHQYKAIIVENVTDVANWVLFPAWLMSMDALGYDHQLVSLNSMHAEAAKAPRAPQSRDRVYIVFHRKGNRAPDVAPRPLAWCDTCDTEVRSVQSWKPGRKVGRYRAQYTYVCPNARCKHATLEPYALPAASAIDWSLPGQRIGDRDRPLSPKTIARIEAGLERYAGESMTFEAKGNTFVRMGADGRPVYPRAWPVSEPTRTLTTSETRALIVPTEGRAQLDRVYGVGSPLRTQNTRNETGLLVPYYGNGTAHPVTDPMRTHGTVDTFAFIAELRGGNSKARHVRHPLSTVTASGNHHMLVRNFSSKGPGGEMCTPVTEPARTITTKGHQSIVGWPHATPAVEDCSFRMLEPIEIQRAMAFEEDYGVLGNRRERVKQLGNAVTPPAAEHLLRAVTESLN